MQIPSVDNMGQLSHKVISQTR